MNRDIPENPPCIQEHHVRLPEQLAGILRATAAHARGYTGKGVRIAIIDSGFFPHPYYVSRGYSVTPVPTAREKNPLLDEYGHGTAQLASLFAVAPEAEVLAIKCMDRDPSLALEKALSLKPKILSCAWGFNIDHPGHDGVPRPYRRMQRLIVDAIHGGVSVVAAGGNGQHAFPGSIPQVIAAGGVYYAPDGKFHASEISSRFESAFFPGRQVPDLCGVVGDRPHGRLLLVPVPPRARLAIRPGFATIAAGDSSDVSAGVGDVQRHLRRHRDDLGGVRASLSG